MVRTRSKSMFVERAVDIENRIQREMQEKARKMAQNRAMNRVQSPSKRSHQKRQWKKDSKKFEAMISMVKQNLAKASDRVLREPPRKVKTGIEAINDAIMSGEGRRNLRPINP